MQDLRTVYSKTCNPEIRFFPMNSAEVALDQGPWAEACAVCALGGGRTKERSFLLDSVCPLVNARQGKLSAQSETCSGNVTFGVQPFPEQPTPS